VERTSNPARTGKLRSWLCGIARNILATAVWDKKQESVHTTEPLFTTMNLPSSESLRIDRALTSKEEIGIQMVLD
jgi:hypothetical protein